MERALHDALCVVKSVLESKSLVPGGGAVEAALSIYLENFATSLVRSVASRTRQAFRRVCLCAHLLFLARCHSLVFSMLLGFHVPLASLATHVSLSLASVAVCLSIYASLGFRLGLGLCLGFKCLSRSRA